MDNAKQSTSALPRFLVCGFFGAVGLGFISFLAGFVGPIILTPEANQGPLLGIFITGPLGTIVGGIIGAIYGAVRQPRK